MSGLFSYVTENIYFASKYITGKEVVPKDFKNYTVFYGERFLEHFVKIVPLPTFLQDCKKIFAREFCQKLYSAGRIILIDDDEDFNRSIIILDPQWLTRSILGLFLFPSELTLKNSDFSDDEKIHYKHVSEILANARNRGGLNSEDITSLGSKLEVQLGDSFEPTIKILKALDVCVPMKNEQSDDIMFPYYISGLCCEGDEGTRSGMEVLMEGGERVVGRRYQISNQKFMFVPGFFPSLFAEIISSFEGRDVVGCEVWRDCLKCKFSTNLNLRLEVCHNKIFSFFDMTYWRTNNVELGASRLGEDVEEDENLLNFIKSVDKIIYRVFGGMKKGSSLEVYLICPSYDKDSLFTHYFEKEIMNLRDAEESLELCDETHHDMRAAIEFFLTQYGIGIEPTIIEDLEEEDFLDLDTLPVISPTRFNSPFEDRIISRSPSNISNVSIHDRENILKETEPKTITEVVNTVINPPQTFSFEEKEMMVETFNHLLQLTGIPTFFVMYCKEHTLSRQYFFFFICEKTGRIVQCGDNGEGFIFENLSTLGKSFKTALKYGYISLQILSMFTPIHLPNISQLLPQMFDLSISNVENMLSDTMNTLGEKINQGIEEEDFKHMIEEENDENVEKHIKAVKFSPDGFVKIKEDDLRKMKNLFEKIFGNDWIEESGLILKHSGVKFWFEEEVDSSIKGYQDIRDGIKPRKLESKCGVGTKQKQQYWKTKDISIVQENEEGIDSHQIFIQFGRRNQWGLFDSVKRIPIESIESFKIVGLNFFLVFCVIEENLSLF